MRWLEWSTIDLEHGLGGVETHARALARELSALGESVSFSRDADALSDPGWDVIHTHGSAVPAVPLRGRGFRVHTLHGTTLGRMAACREWAWPGGYFAAHRENLGVAQADLILAVNPDLWLAKLARRLGKRVVICENGWDTVESTEPLAADVVERLPRTGFWLFVGRGEDRVKATDQIALLLAQRPRTRLVAAPGDGFEGMNQVIKTGRLSPGQILWLLDHAAGLLLPSRYEGNSLAMLEALSRGLPVVATAVGGAPLYCSRAAGLVLTQECRADLIARALEEAEKLDLSASARKRRAEANQKVLPSWLQVAQTALNAVKSARAEKGGV
jgi:glycosyltransferase involved in cell wall biosynthesis